MRVEIERVAPDRLTAQRWTFVAGLGYGPADKIEVRLESWCRIRRATPRHKFRKVGEGYMRRARDTHHHYDWRAPAAEVPMPDDVVAEARRRVIDAIVFLPLTDPS